MDKHMRHLTVTTSEGLVILSQNDHEGEGEIAISPEQIPLLVEWLREAAATLAKSDAE